MCASIFGVIQLCAHGDIRLQQSGDGTVGFGADCSLNEIALLCPRRFSENVKLNACDGPTLRQLFHCENGGGIYAFC